MTTSALKEAAQGNAPSSGPADDYSKFKRRLDSLDAELAPLLGGMDAVAKFKRVVLNAINGNPKLLEADRRSLLVSCMKAAQDGLLPDGREAVLNVYNTKIKDGGKEVWVSMVQYLPMVHGMVKKLYESGQVTYIDAAAVYEKDEFVYERGDNARLTHKPYLGDEPGPIVCAYLVAKLANGEIKREVMPKRDIDKVKAASKAPNGPGWRDWEDQFAIKSVIKRGYKQLPNVPAIEKVIASDNDAIGFQQFDQAPGMLGAQRQAKIEHKPAQTIGVEIQEFQDETERVERAGQQKKAAAEAPISAAPLTSAVWYQTLNEIDDADDLDAHRTLIEHYPEAERDNMRKEADARFRALTE